MLPFANLSDNIEQEYFSDGIADSIITELSRIHRLFVIARNSSCRRPENLDAREAYQRGLWHLVKGGSEAEQALRFFRSAPSWSAQTMWSAISAREWLWCIPAGRMRHSNRSSWLCG